MSEAGIAITVTQIWNRKQMQNGDGRESTRIIRLRKRTIFFSFITTRLMDDDKASIMSGVIAVQAER